MNAYLRVAAAIVVGSIVASGARAADIYSALNVPDDIQASALPSAAASSPSVQDSAVLPASDNELPAGDPVSESAVQNSCCGGDSCCSCMNCCQPLWYASGGAVFLHRDRPTAGSIIGAFPTGTPAFSRGSDFDFGWNAGPDITIARRLDCNDLLAARFFSSDATADLRFVTPGNFIGAGFTGPGGTRITGRDETKLDSLELNWQHQKWDQLSLLAGFRALELADSAKYQIGPTAAGDYTYVNHLYGGQLGADWALTDRCNPLQLNVVGKAGVYGNTDEGGITQLVGGTPVGRFAGQGTATSFVGELDFSASYALTNHIAIRGGYELLWLSDLALATNEASRTLTNPGLLRTVNSDSHLFYQGANVALDFVW